LKSEFLFLKLYPQPSAQHQGSDNELEGRLLIVTRGLILATVGRIQQILAELVVFAYILVYAGIMKICLFWGVMIFSRITFSIMTHSITIDKSQHNSKYMTLLAA
jgi:hypothetical protein